MKRASLSFGRASTLVAALVSLCPAIVDAAALIDEGKLVHVADTRHLAGFNLFVANLYNADRLLFTILAVSLTAAFGLGLGLLMDAIVGLIGLDLERQHTRE